MNSINLKYDKNPLGIEIVFDPDLHQYISNINNKELNYISVTSLISNYFTPFDAPRIAKNVALKRNISPEQVIAEWDKNRNTALRYGTRVHSVAEQILLNTDLIIRPETEREKNAFKFVKEAASKIKDNFEIIGVEKIVFDHRLKIAGTIDLLLKKDNFYLIVDWKTNKELSSVNNYNVFGLGPLKDIPDTNVSKYGLQLSVYEHLLKYANYINKDANVYRVILHVTQTGIKKIHTPFFETHVKNLISDYLLS